MTGNTGISIGRTVQAGGLRYITRQADEELLSHCQAGDYAHVLTSPQSGKSSLIVRTCERLNDEGISSVIIDLSQISEPVTVEEWYPRILELIEDGLELTTEAVPWWEAHSHVSADQRFKQFIEEVVLAETSKPIVLFFDVIERVLPQSFAAEFFAAIRLCFAARTDQPVFHRLTFIMVGVADPLDFPRDSQNLLQTISQRVALLDFSVEEAKPLADGLSLPPDVAQHVLEWIHAWTSGHPYLTQLLCRVIEEQYRNLWAEEDVDKCIRQFLTSQAGQQDGNIRLIHDWLTSAGSGPNSLLPVYRDVLNEKCTVVDEAESGPKSQLKLSGIVYQKNQELHLRNRVYAEVFNAQWVKDHLPETQKKSNWPLALVASLAVLGFVFLVLFVNAQHNLVENQRQLVEAQEKLSTLESGGDTQPITRMDQTVKSSAESQDMEAKLTASHHELEQAYQRMKELELAASEEKQFAHAEISRLTADRERLEAKLSENQQELVEAHELVKQVEEGSIEQKRLTEAKVARLTTDRKRVEGKLTDSQQELASSYERLKELELVLIEQRPLPQSEVAKLATDRTRLEERLKDSQRDLSEALERTRELEAVSVEQKRLADVEIARFSAGREKLESKLATRDKELEGAQGRIRGLELAVKEQRRLSEEEVTRLTEDRTRLEIQFAALQQELTETHQSIQGLETVAAQQKLSGEEEYQRMSRERDQLAKNLSETQRKLAEHQDKIRVINASSGEQERLAELRASEQAKLEANLLASQQELVQAQERIKDLEKTTEQNSLVVGGVAPIVIDQTELQANLTTSQQELVHAQKRIQELEATTGEQKILQARLTDNTEELEKAHNKIRELETTVNQYATIETDQGLTSESNKPNAKVTSGLIDKLTTEIRKQKKRGKQDDLSVLLARQAYLFNYRGEGQKIAQVDEALRTTLKDSTIRLKGHNSRVNSLAFSPMSLFLASGGSDQTVRLWDLNQSNTVPTVLKGHTAGIMCVAFSPDGRSLASGGSDTTVRLWDPSQPKASPTVLQGHIKGVTSVGFSPDGRTLASGSKDMTVRLWDMNQPGTTTLTLRGHAGWVNSVAFSQDGQRLASGSNDLTIRVWDLHHSDAPPIVLRGHRKGITAVTFSPDGSMLASASQDQTVRLWDLSQPIVKAAVLKGHQSRVSKVEFSRDGWTLASVGADKTVRLWDLHQLNARPIILRGHKDRVTSVAFSPDGRILATGGLDNVINVWSTTKTLADEVCDRAKRNLSLKEWTQFGMSTLPYERTCSNLPIHPTYLEEGKKLAQDGSFDNARAIFERAIELDPYLDLDPKAEVEKFSSKGS